MSVSIQLVKRDSYFVQEQFNTLRRILFVLENDQAFYYQYDLNTGELVNTVPWVCRRKQITRWADRIATKEEIASLKTDTAQLRMDEIMEKVMNSLMMQEE